jgi:quercetin 2,3-dioxygenase
MTNRTVHSVATIPVGLNRSTIVTRDVSADLIGEGMDPFIMASFFTMTGPTFPPHPHAGFTVMTYILPESETGFVNQDSTGFSNRISQGGLHATVAGSGTLHEETNEVEGKRALGFQIWLNMTAANRLVPPRPETLEAADVPVVSKDGVELRILAGESNGKTSAFNVPTPFRLIDVKLAPNAIFTQSLTNTEHAFIWMVSGDVNVEGTTAKSLEAVRLNTTGEILRVTAGANGARFMLFAGEPLREPTVFGGPFVGSSQAQIEKFWSDFRSGKMGRLTPFNNRNAA